jgi:hypothetical protein
VNEQYRTFDATSGTGVADEQSWPEPDTQREPAGLDALDLLREAVDHREAAPAPEMVSVPIPGLGWRLMCDPDFTYARYRDWQKVGLPAPQRTGKRPPNALDMDRALTNSLVLVNTCAAVQMQRGDGEWVTVTNSRGEPVTLKDGEFLARFNMVDPRSLLRKLFTVPGRSPDAELIKAGDIVIKAAGYADADEDEDEPDPTV